jgi:hypothetical protein
MTKSDILAFAKRQLQDKQTDLKLQLEDLANGMANDTKSSAGDKYETSRSMSQQEIDKLSVQLQEINRQLAFLPQLQTTVTGEHVQTGSLIKTNNGLFFIGLPLGQLAVENQTIFCVSPSSPVAQHLLGKTVNGTFSLNGRNYIIEQILS